MYLSRSSAVLLLNLQHQVVNFRSVRTVCPLSTIPDAVDILVQAYCTALGDSGLGPVLLVKEGLQDKLSQTRRQPTSEERRTLFRSISTPQAPSSLLAHSSSFLKSIACSSAQSSMRLLCGMCG